VRWVKDKYVKGRRGVYDRRDDGKNGDDEIGRSSETRDRELREIGGISVDQKGSHVQSTGGGGGRGRDTIGREG
jgi:hypothetical protein